MEEKNLQKYIWQGIQKEICGDYLKLYIPFCFGSLKDTPLCLTWDRNGILSDGGRTISELKKRVGDIQPYQNKIVSILSQCGGCTLVGGRIIVKEHFQTVISHQGEYLDYLGGMNLMLNAITLISVLDTVQINEDGTVSI